MNRRDMTPLWFGFLEGGVVLSWSVLFSGLMVQSKEMLALLCLPILLFLSGWAMHIFNRAFGMKGTVASGASLIAAGSLFFLLDIGTTWFLMSVSMIGFVFVYRFSGILSRNESMEDLFRGYFLIESVLFPIFCAICFHYGFKNGIVSTAVRFAALALYFFLRLFVLVTVQRIYRGAWHFRIKDTMLPVGMMVSALAIVVAFPYVAYLAAWIGVPIVKVLDPLLEWLRNRSVGFRPKSSSAGDGQSALELEKWRETGAAAGAIPDWVWVLAALLLTTALLMIFQKKKMFRLPAAPNDTPMQIRRSRFSGDQRLKYVLTDSPVRRIYQEMLQWFEKQGHPIRMNETPREYVKRLREQECFDDALGREVRGLSTSYEQIRYGQASSSEENEKIVRKARQALQRVKWPDA